MWDKLRIVISNRNTLDYLKDAVISIRNNERNKNQIIIYDDNSNDENRKWIIDNSSVYDFEYRMINETCGVGYNRMGITKIRNLAMGESPNDIPVLWFHSDMVAGKNFDSNILKHVRPGRVVSCTRIEPPIHPEQEKVKILLDLGNNPGEFKVELFDDFVEKKLVSFKDKVSDGVFAPSCMFKEDYFSVGGIEIDFIPQSKEDSQLDYKLKKAGVEFVQAWDSLVYHYGGRGSRNKGDNSDSDEWKKSNYKNLKNFQRIWREYPRYTETQSPNPPEISAKIALGILTKNCEKDIIRILNDYEPFFDEIILVDDFSTDNTVDLAKEFFVEIKKNNLCKDKKFKIVKNNLSGVDGVKDFALARNKGVEVCDCPWIFWLDSDEALEVELVNMINRLAVKCELNKKTCMAFPRKNFIDGVQTEVFPDLQARLHRKEVKWVRPVHEMPEPFYLGLFNNDEEAAKSVAIYQEGCILHPKSSVRQKQQNDFYDEIINKAKPVKNKKQGKIVKKLYCNSILFSNEGISKHAREEMKQFKDLGWKIKIVDDLRNMPEDCFKDMCEPIVVDSDDYVTYVNQPPIRENNAKLSLLGSLNLKNVVYFLAYEGSKLPPMWVEVMKHPNIKMVLTPSNYCKELFEEHGIKNVKVLHHGINELNYTPDGKLVDLPNELKDKFLFMFVGTYRGTKKDRKGLRVLADTWKEFKKVPGTEKAHLLLKLNRVYFGGSADEWDKVIDDLGLATLGVTIINNDLTEEVYANLLRTVKCVVAPSLSEGFGIIPLESLCCGTPVIATRTSGFLEYLNDNNALLINVLRKTSAEEVFPYIGPGWHAEWDMPSSNHFKELLVQMFTNYEFEKNKALGASKVLRKEYSWKVIGKQMSEMFENVLKKE